MLLTGVQRAYIYSLTDLIELRKLRKSRQGIDVTKLNEGSVKKRKKQENAEEGESANGGTVISSKTQTDEE